MIGRFWVKMERSDWLSVGKIHRGIDWNWSRRLNRFSFDGTKLNTRKYFRILKLEISYVLSLILCDLGVEL